MARRQLVRALGMVAASICVVAAACTSATPAPLVSPTDAAAEAQVDAAELDAEPVDADAAPVVDAAPIVDADADADADAGSDADADTCNDLAQLGVAVSAQRVVGSSSYVSFDGGTIDDGTYVLTSATRFVEVPGGPDSEPYGTETIRITAGTLEEVFTYPAGDVRRFTSTLTVDGPRVTMTTGCVSSSSPGSHLPELGDWAPFEHAFEMTSFEATTGTVTFWTPVGNHSSVILVFAKLVVPE